MDGTLLRDDSTLSPSMKEALDQLTHNGNKLILTSGRPLPGILEVCEQQEHHYPNMLIIANNGAQIYDCDRKENILKETLALSDIRYLVTAAEHAACMSMPIRIQRSSVIRTIRNCNFTEGGSICP